MAEELMTNEEKEQLQKFDHEIHQRIGDIAEVDLLGPLPPNLILNNDSNEIMMTNEPMELEAEMPEADDYDAKAYDKYLLAEVMLLKGDALITGHGIHHKCDHNGLPIGKQNNNPILDTCIYELQFPDGHMEKFAANVIAEYLYSQIDNEGNQYLIMQEITDHHKDGSAISHVDMWITQGLNK